MKPVFSQKFLISLHNVDNSLADPAFGKLHNSNLFELAPCHLQNKIESIATPWLSELGELKGKFFKRRKKLSKLSFLKNKRSMEFIRCSESGFHHVNWQQLPYCTFGAVRGGLNGKTHDIGKVGMP
jgi:hypothetical protein